MSSDQSGLSPIGDWPMLIKQGGKHLSMAVNRELAQAGHDVTGAQWAVLDHLMRQDGMTQQELADLYGGSKVTAFRLVGKLEEQGLLVRAPDESDGRCNRVRLTPAGRSLHGQLEPVVARAKAMLRRGVSDQDLATAQDVLQRIIANARG